MCAYVCVYVCVSARMLHVCGEKDQCKMEGVYKSISSPKRADEKLKRLTLMYTYTHARVLCILQVSHPSSLSLLLGLIVLHLLHFKWIKCTLVLNREDGKRQMLKRQLKRIGPDRRRKSRDIFARIKFLRRKKFKNDVLVSSKNELCIPVFH